VEMPEVRQGPDAAAELAVCGKQRNEYALGCGAANRGCSRLSAGDSGCEDSRTTRKSRLKGGCGQDCPPHKTGKTSAALR
jgi:hypothetical protein